MTRKEVYRRQADRPLYVQRVIRSAILFRTHFCAGCAQTLQKVQNGRGAFVPGSEVISLSALSSCNGKCRKTHNLIQILICPVHLIRQRHACYFLLPLFDTSVFASAFLSNPGQPLFCFLSMVKTYTEKEKADTRHLKRVCGKDHRPRS